jgi:protoporphyrinogen oxidase
VAKLNLKNIILRTFGIKADPATYFTKYFYPRDGISVLFENMAAEVVKGGNQVLLGCPAVRVVVEGGRASKVAYLKDGVEQQIECDIVLSTLPLPAIVDMISPSLPATTIRHASRLRYRSLKLIYIVLNRPQLTDYHWVYLLDEHYRVNRMSEQKNVSPNMVPPNKTVLCIELSLWKEDPLFKADDEEIYQIALGDLLKMGYGITEADVDSYHVTEIVTAYPVYELNFEEHLLSVLEAVHGVTNLMTLGRHGLFLNNSMDDNVGLGFQVADHINAHGADSRSWLAAMTEFMHLRHAGK